MKFANKELEDVYNIAKKGGLKCYTSQGKDETKEISYIWITNGTNIVYCQTHYSGVSFSSEHKPLTGVGSGFGLTENQPVVVNGLDDITHYFNYRPAWTRRYAVRNWIDWEEFVSKERILKIKEI